MSLDSPVVKEHYENHVHESIHTRFFNHDYGAYGKCTNKLHLLEDLEIDVLLLDGGEFSTYAEFEILKDRAKIIILDDTTELKTKHVHAALISDSDWDCLLESSERHGYSMHRRIA